MLGTGVKAVHVAPREPAISPRPASPGSSDPVPRRRTTHPRIWKGPSEHAVPHCPHASKERCHLRRIWDHCIQRGQLSIGFKARSRDYQKREAFLRVFGRRWGRTGRQRAEIVEGLLPLYTRREALALWLSFTVTVSPLGPKVTWNRSCGKDSFRASINSSAVSFHLSHGDWGDALYMYLLGKARELLSELSSCYNACSLL